MKKLLAFISSVFTLLAIMIFVIPTVKNYTLGIEFKGGYEIVYNISEKDDSPLPDIQDVADVIAERIDIAGVKNPEVSVETTPDGKTSYIRVCVTSSNTEELTDILDLIESDTEITFTDDEGNFLMDGSVLAEEDGAVLSYEDGSPIVLLNIADTATFGSVTESIAGKNMIAWIGYEGANAETGYIGDFAAYSGEGTEDEYNKAAKKVIVNATVNSAITSQTAQITGSFTAEEATQIGKLLSAGNMNFTIERSDVLKVDGDYGDSAFNKALIAGLVGLIAIIIMLICVYKIPGVITSITLSFYAVIIIVVFNLIGGEYGPDTIAAIVIGLGMAVDACIILFERLCDELYKGRSVKSSYEEATKKSLSSILDSNITTIIAACALYFFGKRSVKGFATMLLITTVANVVIMLFVTRILMFLLIKSGKLENHKSWLGVKESRIPDINKGEVQTYFGKFAKIDFVKMSKKVTIGFGIFYAIAALFIGGFSIGTAITGTCSPLNFGLDFKAGATATVNFTDLTDFEKYIPEEMALLQNPNGTKGVDLYTEESVNNFFNESDIFQGHTPSEVDVNYYYDEDEKCYALSIEVVFADIDANDENAVSFLTSFDEDFKQIMLLDQVSDYDDYVTVSQQVSSPTMAKATVLNALLSLLVASALIIVYISIRFRFTYAIAAVAALICDTLSIIAIFGIFRIEVQVEFVSAVLAIIGYSINDTVVIFDRVREIAKETNFGNIDEEGRRNIVNKALQNCTTRSFWTTISTILPVLALIFIGPEATQAFSIAMLVGLISGIGTSIFIAPGLWLILEKRHMMRLHEKAIKDANKVVKKSNTPEEMTIVGIND